ncbi:MAG: hypothetical protein AAF311_09045 [Pseudomonadota bacterium]
MTEQTPERMPLGLTVVTGRICPASGYWRAQGRSDDVFLVKGRWMPTYKRRVVRWMLVRHADEIHRLERASRT